MATLFDGFSFNNYAFCNGIIASGKLCDYEYFLKTVYCIDCKNKRNVSEKIHVFYCVQFLRFSSENILRLFKDRSRRAPVDQNDTKFVFYMKNWFWGFIISLMYYKKRRLIMKAFIEPQFSCCPLILMFDSRTLNNKINRLRERALRIAYSDYKSFNELLQKDNSFVIHHRNVQGLSTEIYKILELG